MDYNIISITFTNMFLSLIISFTFYILFMCVIYYIQGKSIGEYHSILFGDMSLRVTLTSFFIMVIFAFYLFMIMIDSYNQKEERIEENKGYIINLNINYTSKNKQDTYEETFNH